VPFRGTLQRSLLHVPINESCGSHANISAIFNIEHGRASNLTHKNCQDILIIGLNYRSKFSNSLNLHGRGLLQQSTRDQARLQDGPDRRCLRDGVEIIRIIFTETNCCTALGRKADFGKPGGDIRRMEIVANMADGFQ